MKYFDKNPKEGGIEISLWDYLEQSGIIDKAKKLGKTINPTHNFELLKQTRIEQYAIKKDKFVKERELNKIETKAIDKILFFKEWLYKELETVEQWLSDKYPNGDRKIIRETFSNQLEILKYKQFIENEIEGILLKQVEYITGTDIELWLSLSIEQKYEYAFIEYKKMFPKGTEENFRELEILAQKKKIENYENNPKPKAFEIQLYIEANKLVKYIESYAPQKNEPENIKEIPNKFEELFYDTNFVSPCIDILKEVTPPLIDTDNNYIGKLKGAFCVWIDEMQRQGIVKKFSDRKIFASLLPQKIKRFTIDESMFGKYQSKAESQYRNDIKALISQIKHSQDSH